LQQASPFFYFTIHNHPLIPLILENLIICPVSLNNHKVSNWYKISFRIFGHNFDFAATLLVRMGHTVFLRVICVTCQAVWLWTKINGHLRKFCPSVPVKLNVTVYMQNRKDVKIRISDWVDERYQIIKTFFLPLFCWLLFLALSVAFVYKITMLSLPSFYLWTQLILWNSLRTSWH
jgi:hypothetical protein